VSVRHVLSQPERKWQAKPPASEVEIAQLQSRVRTELPQEYLELLQFSNGGDGPLALPPLWFQLYAVKDCIELCHANQHVVENFPHFLFFGSNGGLESIAFDLRVGPPWGIVMIDQIAGPESAREIAPNMAAFIEAIGLHAEREE
jgi:SMI1 / KNR4 family (SUKH-1)